MAKKGGASEIASVSVGVTADTTQLSAGLNKAKAETQAFATDMGAAGDRGGKEFGDKAGKGMLGGLREARKGIHKLLMGVLAVPFVLKEAFGLGQKIREQIDEGMRSGTDTGKNILDGVSIGQGADAAKKSLSEVRSEIDKLAAELGTIGQRSIWDRVFGSSSSKLQDTVKILRDAEASFSRQIRAAEKAAKLEERRAADAKRWLDIKQQGLELEDKLAAEADSQAEAALRKFRMIDAMVGTLKAGGEDAIADRLAKANADAFARAMALVAKQMADEFRKVGREITDDMRNAIRESLRQVIPDIRAIGPKLDVINRSSNRLYGRGV